MPRRPPRKHNEGGRAATLHPSFDEARKAVRDHLFDPENEPPSTHEERERWEAEIGCMVELSGFVNAIRGSEAWREWIYVAPIEESATCPT